MAKAAAKTKVEGCDVAVVGAGPAGATAALRLAALGHQVCLIDRESVARKQPGLAWLNSRITETLAQWKVPVKSILDRPFSDVIFFNADFSKTAKPAFKDPAGYLVERAALVSTITEAARKAGATLHAGAGVLRVRLRESEVQLELENGTAMQSRLLVLATGHRGELFEQAGFSRATASGVAWSAQVDRELSKSAGIAEPRVVVVLGLDRRGGFVIFCMTSDRISATVNWFGDREGASAALKNACSLAFAKKAVPVDLSDGATAAPLVRNPVAAALDMDTHVSKHCVLIGDAGGFIAAASQEGLYPAIWSADIAAGVIDEALRSRHSQDVLKTFDTVWRMKMADYLRSPNTDPQFLVPLVFSNQPMADRMAAAFFSGENI